jgi:hypothetical protein
MFEEFSTVAETERLAFSDFPHCHRRASVGDHFVSQGQSSLCLCPVKTYDSPPESIRGGALNEYDDGTGHGERASHYN